LNIANATKQMIIITNDSNILISFKLWRGTMLTKYCSYYSEHNYDGR